MAVGLETFEERRSYFSKGLLKICLRPRTLRDGFEQRKSSLSNGQGAF